MQPTEAMDGGGGGQLYVEEQVCVAAPGSPGLLRPVLSSLPISPVRSAVRGPLMWPLWRVPGPFKVSWGSQRPPGLPETVSILPHPFGQALPPQGRSRHLSLL